MIRACYLIFSHDWQPQLARLATTISRLSPNALVVLHHDPSKGPLDRRIFSGIANLHLVPEPVPARWGQYSLVKQQLHGLRFCMTELAWDWIITLSGQSYPLQPLSDFEQMLASTPHDAFVRHFDALAPATWGSGLLPRGEGEKRYLYRYCDVPKLPFYHLLPPVARRVLGSLRVKLNELQPFFKIVTLPGSHPRLGVRRPLRRSLGGDFKLCVGRLPLQMNRRACEFVLNYVDTHPSYGAYFRTTLIPDEGFFTSLLANARNLRIGNDALRHIKWNRSAGASRGAVILPDEIPEAIRSGKPFGLKFDMEAAPESLDAIDKWLKAHTATSDAQSIGLRHA